MGREQLRDPCKMMQDRRAPTTSVAVTDGCSKLTKQPGSAANPPSVQVS